MRTGLRYLAILPCLLAAGCLTYDEEAANAVNALRAGDPTVAEKWSAELADTSASARLGEVESGRVGMLGGHLDAADGWFRKSVDEAIDRKERQPVIKLSETWRTTLAATFGDDTSMVYGLSPYELNLALEYGILAQAFLGKREDALADARLACYVQDNLAAEYGADVTARQAAESTNAVIDAKSTEARRICEEQGAALNEMIASARNSWENPVLWWLTGVLFEADGDIEAAWQSYRRAGTTGVGNTFFARDMQRADTGRVTPAPGKSKLVVIMDDGFVPRLAALKIPLRIYATMSIDIPMYKGVGAYVPQVVTIGDPAGVQPAAVGLDVRSLAARNLSELMPGIVARNLTRAATSAAIQAAGRSGNNYSMAAAELTNLALLLYRSADTRSWVTLPDAQYVWCADDLAPGEHDIAVNVAGGASTIRVPLAAGETRLLWIANCGGALKHQSVRISNP